jgi:hypothetical protein
MNYPNTAQRHDRKGTPSVDGYEMFAHLRKQKKAVLLEYLRAAFDEMTAKQRRVVFADLALVAQARGDLPPFRSTPLPC